jgi:hypothetical protein
MGDTPETTTESKQRPIKEYEDPHYHDEDEVAPNDDVLPRPAQAAPRRTPRRLPPPRRRFFED